MIFKRRLTKTFGNKQPYTSVESVLQSVIDFCSVENIDECTIDIHIPSERRGLPCTDKVEIKCSDGELFEFCIIESEALDYFYIKYVERMSLIHEISMLSGVSGEPETHGYEFFSFGEL